MEQDKLILKPSKKCLGVRYAIGVTATLASFYLAYKFKGILGDTSMEEGNRILGAGLAMCGSFIAGIYSAAGTLLTYRLHKKTIIDKQNKEITQNSTKTKYDAFMEVTSTRGLLERLLGYGTVYIKTIRIGENSPTIETISIPYQKNPKELEEKIMQDAPTYQKLRQKLLS